MKAVIQRVNNAFLSVDGKKVSSIGKGITVLVSVGKNDTKNDADWLVQKILNLRIFSESGKMTYSVINIKGEILVVSQFTLHANVHKGKKLSFEKSASKEHAKTLLKEIVAGLKKHHQYKVAEGKFGEEMKIDLQLIGPVTILLDSDKKKAF